MIWPLELPPEYTAERVRNATTSISHLEENQYGLIFYMDTIVLIKRIDNKVPMLNSDNGNGYSTLSPSFTSGTTCLPLPAGVPISFVLEYNNASHL